MCRASASLIGCASSRVNSRCQCRLRWFMNQLLICVWFRVASRINAFFASSLGYGHRRLASHHSFNASVEEAGSFPFFVFLRNSSFSARMEEAYLRFSDLRRSSSRVSTVLDSFAHLRLRLRTHAADSSSSSLGSDSSESSSSSSFGSCLAALTDFLETSETLSAFCVLSASFATRASASRHASTTSSKHALSSSAYAVSSLVTRSMNSSRSAPYARTHPSSARRMAPALTSAASFKSCRRLRWSEALPAASAPTRRHAK